ncbi:uncharacterized protein TA18445 [Theileria annulata]|uniref:Uncharacterized protein n=1 Tax=Theileria annulata TaxID=5874 RepID=Q4UAW6_THEAN|nr:uncharacterized protein TA18445 [Theileria annulata]CAI76035.1 hypothetical protein TA18445 [Theileria annulata]|eukprot:XP_955511.1 hypothetical protein TA18445 [Theileria annulata]
MTTILEAEFGSDSEDSDYELSEVSSDEDSSRSLKREEKKRREREKMLERVNLMFDDMIKASDFSYRHPDHEKDDFMLQFHKKSPPTPKIRTSIDFEEYLDKNTSRVFNSSNDLDIKQFKQKCHQTPNSEKLEMIKNAVAVKDAEPATIKTTYKFAGTTYELFLTL